MRQVFTSLRLENVEKVAQLLEEQGIEVRITHGRSFRGNRRRTFSYRESANENPQPAVWVVKSEDQPRARALLRDMGLLDSGRSPTSYLPDSLLERDRDGEEAAGRRRAFRIRVGLLLAIAFALGLGMLAWRKPAQETSTTAGATTAAATPAATAAADDGRYVVATPSALAAMLIDVELRVYDIAVACVSVDGADPAQTVLDQLKAGERSRARPQSACADVAAGGAVWIGIREYRTDGSGTGTVRVEIADAASGDDREVQTRTLEVRREDVRWRVTSIVM
jgi:hypothetical protein